MRFPPGRVAVRLGPEYRSAYRRLYGRYRTVLNDLPVLRDRDFDGRGVLMAPAQLDALNKAFIIQDQDEPAHSSTGAFSAQEQGRRRLFKRLQYLS